MSKRLFGAGLLVGTMLLGPPSPVAAQDEVTMTIGLPQDMSSPNVTVGYTVAEFEVWNLQYATLTTKAADDFCHDSRPRRVVGRAPTTG